MRILDEKREGLYVIRTLDVLMSSGVGLEAALHTIGQGGYGIISEDFSKIIAVTDNLGNGDITINYTLENALAYAHSHAIHHFASIGFLVNQLGIELQDADFGYNPTTPKK